MEKTLKFKVGDKVVITRDLWCVPRLAHMGEVLFIGAGYPESNNRWELLDENGNFMLNCSPQNFRRLTPLEELL